MLTVWYGSVCQQAVRTLRICSIDQNNVAELLKTCFDTQNGHRQVCSSIFSNILRPFRRWFEWPAPLKPWSTAREAMDRCLWCPQRRSLGSCTKGSGWCCWTQRSRRSCSGWSRRRGKDGWPRLGSMDLQGLKCFVWKAGMSGFFGFSSPFGLNNYVK